MNLNNKIFKILVSFALQTSCSHSHYCIECQVHFFNRKLFVRDFGLHKNVLIGFKSDSGYYSRLVPVTSVSKHFW